MQQKLALIGFGVVGQGFAEIIHRKKSALRDRYGVEFSVVAISDMLKGSIYDPDGLDIPTVLDLLQQKRSLEEYPVTATLERGWDAFRTIKETNADTVIEITYTNVQTGQPGLDHCRAALEHSKNVVTTNKGPIALAYAELMDLARRHGVRIGFEGTVMSGTPTLRMPLDALAGNDILEIRGILNGTSNYILTRMESGLGYAEALAEAQKLGYAEADPTSDVEGYDALYKVMILSQAVMDRPVQREAILREGITGITPQSVQDALAQGKRWKLVARVKASGQGVIAQVKPEMLPVTDPLASVSGALNAITYECDLIGPVTVTGPGAGKIETGYALLIDCLNVAKTSHPEGGPIVAHGVRG